MPAEPKLTPWIDWPTKPVRVGWYDVTWIYRNGAKGPERRLWWDGRKFFASPDGDPIGGFGFWQGDQWRGLAEPPKEQGNDN